MELGAAAVTAAAAAVVYVENWWRACIESRSGRNPRSFSTCIAKLLRPRPPGSYKLQQNSSCCCWLAKLSLVVTANSFLYRAEQEEVEFGAEANDALPSRRGGPPRRPRLKSEEKSQRKTRMVEQAESSREGGRTRYWPL